MSTSYRSLTREGGQVQGIGSEAGTQQPGLSHYEISKAIVHTMIEWSDILSDVSACWALHQEDDLQLRFLGDILAYHLCTIVVVNFIVSAYAIRKLRKDHRDAWTELKKWLGQGCRPLLGLMFFVLSIFNAGSSRILFAALSKSLKQMPSEGESKNEIIESVSAARNMMEAWALCPRLWEDWPQLIGQFLAAALQFRNGHQVSLQIQVSILGTFMNLFLNILAESVKLALTLGEPFSPSPEDAGKEDHSLQGMWHSLAMVCDILGYISLPARFYILCHIQGDLQWLVCCGILMVTFFLHVLLQLLFLFRNKMFFRHLRGFELMALLNRGALVILGSYASTNQMRLYGVADEEGQDEASKLRTRLEVGNHFFGGASLLARVLFMAFMAYEVWLNYSEIGPDYMLIALAMPDFAQFLVSSFIVLACGDDESEQAEGPKEDSAQKPLKEGPHTSQKDYKSSITDYVCLFFFTTTLLSVLGATYLGSIRPPSPEPILMLRQISKDSANGLYAFSGWKENHPMYQQIGQVPPHHLFYWHSRNEVSTSRRWVLATHLPHFFNHDPCEASEDCVKSPQSDPKSLPKGRHPKNFTEEIGAAFRGIMPNAEITKAPPPLFEPFVLCSTNGAQFCGRWRQEDVKASAELGSLSILSLGEDVHRHRRPRFGLVERFSKTQAGDPSHFKLVYRMHQWCIMKDDQRLLCQAQSTDLLPFRFEFNSTAFEHHGSWLECDKSGKCNRASSEEVVIGGNCHSECQGCMGPTAHDCLKCRHVNKQGACTARCGENEKPDDEGLCSATCAAFQCPTSYIYVPNFERRIGSTRADCCEESCGTVSCPDGQTHIASADTTAGNTPEQCCTAACNVYRCPEKQLLKPQASKLPGDTAETCCENSCALFGCPTDYIHKQGAKQMRGHTANACCEKTCSAYMCPI